MLRRLADLVLFRSQLERFPGPVDRAGDAAPRELGIDGSRAAALARDPYAPLAPAPREDATPLIATLSATGRILAGLLGAAEAPPKVPQTPAPAAPLRSGPAPDAAALARHLKSALAESGLFYESHQAQWVAGERPIEQLMREPQAGVTPLPREEAAAVHPSLHDIVRQQVEALESGRILWYGPMWPEQPLQWEIAREPAPHDGTPAPTAWKTNLRLALPRLGEIDVTLSVGADGVGIALTTGAAATALLLLAHGDDLRQALRAGGIVPVALTIAPGSPAEPS